MERYIKSKGDWANQGFFHNKIYKVLDKQAKGNNCIVCITDKGEYEIWNGNYTIVTEKEWLSQNNNSPHSLSTYWW